MRTALVLCGSLVLAVRARRLKVPEKTGSRFASQVRSDVRTCAVRVCVAAFVAALASACTGGGRAKCEIEFTDAGSVRVFVVGHAFTLSDTVSYASYDRSFREHLDAIAPCRSADRPNLVVFPEDSGLLAWFIGTRGANARSQTSSDVAFVAIYSEYQAAAAHYEAQFPGISTARALTLALGDVGWRAVHLTFGGIARDHEVWVMTSANLPDAGKSTDPALVDLLGDPDLGGSDGVWIASGPDCFNKALLFAPDGNLSGTVDKVYLTDPEEQLLDLSNGSLAGLRFFETPFARIGAAISRDAFYPPFLQRMEDLGVELVVQPEAWSAWTIEENEGYWEPDAILASGWLHTQKYQGIRHNVTPMLVGNLYESVFDGQVWITKKAAPSDSDLGFVGSQTGPGWVTIGPWTYDDSGIGTLAERRAALRALGDALAPGSGSPEENAYAASVIGADLVFDRAPVSVVSSGGYLTVALAPGSADAQTGPDLAYDAGGRLYAAWTQAPGFAMIATSDDDGATWTAPRGVTVGGDVKRVDLAAGSPGFVAVVSARGYDGGLETSVTISTNGGTSFRTSLALGPPALDRAIAIGPGDRLAVAWSKPSTEIAPRVVLALSTDLGITWSPASVIDPSIPDTTIAGSKFQPAIAYSGANLAAAWIDYRERDWQVWAVVDTGSGFGAAVRLTEDATQEVLAGDPQLVATTAGGFAIAWDEVRERRGHADVRGARFTPGAGWSPIPAPAGGADEGAFASRFRPALAWRSGALLAVFQDTKFRKSALAIAAFGDGSSPARADDTGAAPVSLTRPRIAARLGASAVIALEDDREGRPRIYLLRVP